jgi:hypothetical protein
LEAELECVLDAMAARAAPVLRVTGATHAGDARRIRRPRARSLPAPTAAAVPRPAAVAAASAPTAYPPGPVCSSRTSPSPAVRATRPAPPTPHGTPGHTTPIPAPASGRLAG